MLRRVTPAIVICALVAAASCSGDSDNSDGSATSGRSDDATVSTSSSTTADVDSDSTPAPDEPSTTTTVAPKQYDFTAVAPIVERFIAENDLNGAGLVVVDREQGVVHEDYWGEFGPDRISLVASSSKMVSAGVLLHLADAGQLDMDAPVADVVPWGVGNPTITPAQLVSNSSGLVGLGPNPAFPPYLCQYVADGTLQECAERIFTTTDDDADVIPPDTEFRYGGAQWQVAGAVAEVASGKSWAELIDEIYVEPCGLETLAYNNHFSQLGAAFDYPESFDGDPSVLEPTDNPNMEGGMYVTTGDYAELLLMHLRGGRCGDTQVLSAAALDRLHADRTGDVYDSPVGYGMGWWVDRTSGRINDPGAYGAVPWLDLDDGFGAYLVIEATSALGSQLAGELYEPVEAAVLAAR